MTVATNGMSGMWGQKGWLRLSRAIAVTSVIAIVVAACSNEGPPPCIPYGVLSDASEMRVIGDSAADDFSIAVTGITVECEVFEDMVYADARIYFRAERAAAEYPLTIEFPAFQAITAGRVELIDKEIIIRRITFDEGQTAFNGVVSAASHYPLEHVLGGNPYELIVGVQVDQMGLTANQERRTRSTDRTNRSPYIPRE